MCFGLDALVFGGRVNGTRLMMQRFTDLPLILPQAGALESKLPRYVV